MNTTVSFTVTPFPIFDGLFDMRALDRFTVDVTHPIPMIDHNDTLDNVLCDISKHINFVQVIV